MTVLREDSSAKRMLFDRTKQAALSEFLQPMLSFASIQAALSSCSGKAAGNAALAGISKAGTLLKQCSADGHEEGGEEWKSLFFVLNGHSLTFYPLGQRKGGFTTPSGDILLTGDTKVVDASSSVLRIDTGFEVLFLRAKNTADARDWKRAIESNVERVPDLPRGYFTKIHAWRMRRKKRLFFMLHEECITQHSSHAETSVISSMIPLLEATTVSTFGETGIVIGSGPKSSKKWNLIADTKREQCKWINAISQAITSRQVMSSLPLIPVNFPDATLDGFLSMRHEDGIWNEHFFVLTKDSFHRVQQDTTTKKTSSKKFSLTPNTMVSSTSLNAHSFEVVTFSDVLHLNVTSKESKDQWMATIRGLVASTGKYSKEDKLQEASLSRDCEYYNVLFKSTNSPGLVLERRGDIALVSKVTRSLQHCVFSGSALIAVNSESVVSQSYEYIVKLLSDWKPPLTLRFCSPPTKKGWLQVLVHPNPYDVHRRISPQSRMKLPNNEPFWEQVFAELKAGKFIIHRGGADNGSNIDNDVLQLRGAAVALVDPKDARRTRNCFRIMGGLETITLQASSHDEMMDWATSLVHGVSIESGGGFLLDHDKIHDEKLWFASLSKGFSSDIEDLSSSTYASPYPTQATRPPRKGVSKLPATISEYSPHTTAHNLSDGAESNSTAAFERTNSIRSEATSSYTSRPSDEANSECKSLLNHRYFRPSDAGGSNDEVELDYSSDDDSMSTFLDEDPFEGSACKLQPVFPAIGENTTFPSTDSSREDTRRAENIDSDGFPVFSGGFPAQEARPASPAEKSIASNTRSRPPNAFDDMGSGEGGDWVDVVRLSDQELDAIYDSCRGGDHVNPLSFCKLVRSVDYSDGNPYQEMNLFAQFSADGSGGRGVLSKNEFISGVRRIEEEDGIECSLYQKLVQHIRSKE